MPTYSFQTSSTPFRLLVAATVVACGIVGCERASPKPSSVERPTPVAGAGTTSPAAVAAPPVAAPVAAPPVTTKETHAHSSRPIFEFKPSLHGFNFRNSFTGSPLPFSLGKLDDSLGVPQHYGLCGGMSAAAADFFLARREVPELRDPPAKGTDLYSYLYQRQVDSLGMSLAYAGIFAEWMHLPDTGPAGTHVKSVPTLKDIQEKLSQGTPVMLGLVLTSAKDRGKLWENHQVVAFAISDAEAGDPLRRRISIYDPNFPDNDEVVIEVQPTIENDADSSTGHGSTASPVVPILGIRCTRTAPGKRTAEIRGLFVMPYEPRVPPDTLR